LSKFNYIKENYQAYSIPECGDTSLGPSLDDLFTGMQIILNVEI